MAISNSAMVTHYENIISNTLAELETISEDATVAGGKPDAMGPNAVQHDEYERKLWDRIRWAKEQIAYWQDPVEVVSRGFA